MTMTAPYRPGRLLQYLPAMYREDPFLGRFLAAFEDVLLGPADGSGVPLRGLEQVIDGLATLFDPMQTPEEFLPWLARWTAFSLRADLPPAKQRDFIANAIQLYRWRGTKHNLQKLMAIFTVLRPVVTEPEAAELQVGVHSTVGVDTYLAGAPPHFFQVTISLPDELRSQPLEVRERQLEIARDLIEMEKPAHTTYRLDVIFPSMQVGVQSTVGVDTILGTAV